MIEAFIIIAGGIMLIWIFSGMWPWLAPVVGLAGSYAIISTWEKSPVYAILIVVTLSGIGWLIARIPAQTQHTGREWESKASCNTPVDWRKTTNPELPTAPLYGVKPKPFPSGKTYTK